MARYDSARASNPKIQLYVWYGPSRASKLQTISGYGVMCTQNREIELIKSVMHLNAFLAIRFLSFYQSFITFFFFRFHPAEILSSLLQFGENR